MLKIKRMMMSVCLLMRIRAFFNVVFFNGCSFCDRHKMLKSIQSKTKQVTTIPNSLGNFF